MNKILAFAKLNILITVVVVLLVVAGVWYFFRKDKSYSVTIEGEATPADETKAMRLAESIKADMSGWNIFGHNNAPYIELRNSSDIVFALTFEKYHDLTGNNLSSDLNAEGWFGPIYDTVEQILERSTSLNLL